MPVTKSLPNITSTFSTGIELPQEEPQVTKRIWLLKGKKDYVVLGFILLVLFIMVGGIFYFREVDKKYSITGVIFHDLNANNKRDAGDLGLSNIEVKLELSNGKILETTTNASGEYTFKELLRYGNRNILKPLHYRIKIGTVKYFKVIGSDVKEIERLTSLTIDFGLNCGCVLGNVYLDENNNQVRDKNEKGIPNIMIKMTTPWKTTLSTATDDDGLYIFSDIPPDYTEEGNNNGNYVVYIINPGSEAKDLEPIGKVSEAFKFPPDFRLDFPLGPKSNIYGLVVSVYIDKDRNGLRDSSEKGYPDAEVSLLKGGSASTIKTDSLGSYVFSNLNAVYETIVLTVPKGYESTTDSNEDDGFVSKLIKIVPNEQVLEFGIAQKRTPFPPINPNKIYEVSGTVFIDENENGIKDPGEKGFSCSNDCISNVDGTKGVLLSLVQWGVNEMQQGGLGTDGYGFYSTKQWLKNKRDEPKGGIYLLSLRDTTFNNYRPTTPTDRIFTLTSDKTVDFGLTPFR